MNQFDHTNWQRNIFERMTNKFYNFKRTETFWNVQLKLLHVIYVSLQGKYFNSHEMFDQIFRSTVEINFWWMTISQLWRKCMHCTYACVLYAFHCFFLFNSPFLRWMLENKLAKAVVLLLLTFCWLLLPLWESVIVLCFLVRYVHTSIAIILMGEERAGCFALVVFLVSRDGGAALPRGATGLSAVCDCGISWSYSLTIFGLNSAKVWKYVALSEGSVL